MPIAILSIIALVLASTTSIHAQAFGVDRQMAAMEAGAYAQVQDRLLLDPPEPNDNFVYYTGRVSRSGEICEVSGTTSQHRRDPLGVAVREQYDRLRSHLARKYGPGDLQEEIEIDSPWEADADWVLSLLQGERHHRSEWSGPLPAGLKRIRLNVDAVGVGRSRVTLTYVFDIGRGCEHDGVFDSSGL